MKAEFKYQLLYVLLSVVTVFAGYASILIVSLFISMTMMHYLIKISLQWENKK